MRPTVVELKSIWMYAYSKAAFHETTRYVDAIETVEPDSTLCHALVSASIVAYARPFTYCRFTANDSTIPLKDIEPPSHLKNVHEKFLAARHQTVGHKDAREIKGELPRTVLVMKRALNNAAFHPLGVHEMKRWGRQDMKELCSHFIRECDRRLAPLMEKYESEFLRRPAGTYRLVICDPPREWLESFDDRWVAPPKAESNSDRKPD